MLDNAALREMERQILLERERCAKIAERKAEHMADTYAQVCHDIALAIRLGSSEE